MRRNTHPEYVGLESLKEKHAWQLALFEGWVESGDWCQIHRAHYDWWMFPIDAASGYGYAWTVYEGDVDDLTQDHTYMDGYLRGAEILLLSWGWDLGARRPVADPHPDQAWQDWPIRLHKCARSLQLFGRSEEFRSVRAYALSLLREGVDMTYRGRDLSELYRE